MSLSRRAVLLLALPLALSLQGCGFHPLYASGDKQSKSTVSDLSRVKVALIADRAGQLVRNELLDLMNPTGEPAKPIYFLTVRTSESKQSLGILKDETASRSNYVLNAGFHLTNAKGATLYSSTATSQASYNILDEHYATTASEQNSRERVAKEIAQAIHLQLSSYFSRARESQTQPAK